MSSHQSGSPPNKRTQPVRTEQPRPYGAVAGPAAAVRTSESVENAPIDTIPRTEQAATPALRSPGPLDLDGTSRVLTAALLDTSMRKHWNAREAWASNRCVADHYCENTESVVRRWRNGEKSIPLAALHVLPITLAEDLARGILKARGVDLRQSMTTLANAVDGIDAPIAPDDRDEVGAQLRDARDRIIARLDRLAVEGT
jgi:hypothetical protein